MDSLFAPADAIIGRLSYTYKIALASLMFVVPVSFLVWLNFSHTQAQVERLEKEQLGIE
jgi:hypothetical protein